MTATFGDATADDLVDVAPPDPSVVARRLVVELRARIPGGFRTWDEHTAAERAAWTEAVDVVLGIVLAEHADA